MLCAALHGPALPTFACSRRTAAFGSALRSLPRRSAPRTPMATAAAKNGAARGAAAASKMKCNGEAPAGMEAEARLLEQLTSIPQITKATVRPARGGGGVQITVSSREPAVAFGGFAFEPLARFCCRHLIS
jgi:hypothetical protein